METFQSQTWALGCISFAWGGVGGGGWCVGEMQLGMIGPVTPGTARASSEHPG